MRTRIGSCITFHHAGLTLTELLMVCLIISVLLTLLLETIKGSRERAEQAQCASRLRQVGTALESYRCEYRRYPIGARPSQFSDSTNWNEWRTATDPWDCYFPLPTKYPRVPRLLESYTGSVDVLICPGQGQTAFWPDRGPFRYNTNNPFDPTNPSLLWVPRVLLRSGRKEALAACQIPDQAFRGLVSWRHGRRLPGPVPGENQHLLTGGSVHVRLCPETWADN